MVTFPYNSTDFFFTLDDSKVIEVSSENETSYFNLTVTITYFAFYSSTSQEKTLEYKLPLFQGQQTYVIGRKIHRILEKQKSFRNTFGFICKTATVNFEVVEIDADDDSVLATETLNGVKFIPGTLPVLKSDNLAFLCVNSNYERVTQNGMFFINTLLTLGEHQLKLYKNNEEVYSEIIEATPLTNVFSKKIIVKDYSGAKGDVFTVKLADGLLSKSFVVFPDNENSKQLLFVGPNNFLTSLECTGHFSFTNNYDQLTHTYFNNLVEVLEIVKTTKTKTLTINTGWVLKTDVTIIDALLESGTVLLVNNDATVLEMVPLAKKMTGEDSEKFLYEYELEFQINKSYA